MKDSNLKVLVQEVKDSGVLMSPARVIKTLHNVQTKFLHVAATEDGSTYLVAIDAKDMKGGCKKC